MSGWLIIVTGCIYLAVAVDQYLKGCNPMAVVYFGYALANVGMYYVTE